MPLWQTPRIRLLGPDVGIHNRGRFASGGLSLSLLAFYLLFVSSYLHVFLSHSFLPISWILSERSVAITVKVLVATGAFPTHFLTNKSSSVNFFFAFLCTMICKCSCASESAEALQEQKAQILHARVIAITAHRHTQARDHECACDAKS